MVERETLYNQPVNGLNQDVSPVLQPKGSYRYALNAVSESLNGDLGFKTTEQGNETCVDMPSTHIILGSCFIGNEESLIFVYDEANATSRIYTINHISCEKTEVVQLDCLNFNVRYPIEATFRIRNGCERWVYFVDGLNSDKAINLDYTGTYTDCKLLEQKLYGNEPYLQLDKVFDQGGSIPAGTIQVTCRYLDSENNPTEYFATSPTIPVYDADDSQFKTIIGSKSTTTQKSFRFKFSNLDTSYSKLEIAVVQTVDGISTAYVADTVVFDNSEIYWTYIGTHTSTFSSLQALVQQFSDLTVSKTITQKDNRLLKGNVKAKQYDWWAFQKSAMDIETMYTTKQLRSNTVNSSANNPYYYLDYRSYMRDEVYAFGIQWVMKDGTKSPVLHIPGRSELTTLIDPNVITLGNANNHPLRNQVSGTSWDKELLTVMDRASVANPDEVAYDDVRHLSDYFTNCDTCDTFDATLLGDTKVKLRYDSSSAFTLYLNNSGGTYASLKADFEEVSPDATNTDTLTLTLPGPNVNTSVTYNAATPQDNASGKFTLTLTDSQGCEFKAYFDVDFDTIEKVIYVTNISGTGVPVVNILGTFPNMEVEIELTTDMFTKESPTCQIERWRVYNTAIQTYPVALSNHYSNGVMGYHESDNETYPEVFDCEGNSVFGTSTSTPVRHHRFPDSTLEPHYHTEFAETGNVQGFDEVVTYIYPLGAYFSNIEPPAAYVDKVNYYRIVRMERTDNDKSVLDKGILNYYRREADGSGNCATAILPNYEGLTNEYTTADKIIQTTEIISPAALLKKSALNVDHLKLERIPKISRKDRTTAITLPNAGGNNKISDVHILDNDASNGNLLATNLTDNILWTHRKVTNEYLVQYNNQFRSAKQKVGTDVPGYQQLSYWNDLYDTIGTTNISKHGSYTTMTYNKHAQYVGLKRVNGNQYYGLLKRAYIPCQRFVMYYDDNNSATKVVDVHGGDTFISRMEYLQTFFMNTSISSKAVDTGVSATPFKCTTVAAVDNTYITRMSFMVETEVNTELRHLVQNQYFYPLVNSLSIDFQDPMESTLGYHLTSGNYDGWKELYYNYNQDYSMDNVVYTMYPPDKEVQYCTNCDNSFPNRILYTNPSNPEDTSDNYRQFLVNNFTDVQGHKGSITKLIVDQDYLLVDCKRTRWIVPTSNQQLEVTAATAYIGLGDYLSIPPKEVSDAMSGFVGSQSQWSYAQSEYGVLSVDQEDGRIFVSNNGQPKPISQIGLRNYFEENLPSFFLKQFVTLTGKPADLADDYPFRDNPYNPYGGIGVFSTYDTRFERWIISKRDFVLTATGLDLFNKTDGTPGVDKGIQYDTYGFYWYYIGAPNVKTYLIPEENPLWFENKSFTISFSIKDDSWTSWHSYLPHYYIQTRLSFASGKNTLTDIFKHTNSTEHRKFYGTVYPFIVEQVLTTQSAPSLFSYIQYQSVAEKYNSTYGEFLINPDVTFNKILLYNSYQCSNELTLEKASPSLSANITNNSSKAFYTYRENFYSVNQFKDLRTDKTIPMFTKDWATTQSSYFIDKVLNTNAVNSNNPWYQRQDFRDRYLIVRLILSNFEDYKVTFNYLFGHNHITNG